MTCHPQNGRGYGHVTVCRDAARGAGLKATAELLVLSNMKNTWRVCGTHCIQGGSKETPR